MASATGFHQFSAKTIDGADRQMSHYAGRVCLVVNVASAWGYTKQYADLQPMYQELEGKGLSILGFPCNQFAAEEPGSNAEIKNFACSRYSTTWDLFEKIEVNGSGAHPIYTYLKEKFGKADIGWNFEYFLIDQSGVPVQHFRTLNPSVKDEILKLLA